MPSLRNSGRIVGSSVGIKQLARQCNLSFPLSLRKSVGAPPPGRIVKKGIDLLQRKFDQLFNKRFRPLLPIRFDGNDFGTSTLTATDATISIQEVQC